jgi:hypothetical protein
MTLCGGKTRAGTDCKRPAGWGTDHVGEGKCKLHAGSSLRGVDHPNYKTGRYIGFLPDNIKAKVAQVSDDNPLDILPELEIQRGLFAEYISRFQEGIPLKQGDIAQIIEWATEITRTVERITKMKNETALTGVEIKYLAARMSDLAVRYIDDPTRRAAFIEELFSIVESSDAPLLK